MCTFSSAMLTLFLSFPRSTKLSRAWTFQFRIFINVRFQLESHEKLSAVFGWRSKVRTFLTWHIESRLLVRKITGTDGYDMLILFNELNHTYTCRSMFIKTNRIGNCCCVCCGKADGILYVFVYKAVDVYAQGTLLKICSKRPSLRNLLCAAGNPILTSFLNRKMENRVYNEVVIKLLPCGVIWNETKAHSYFGWLDCNDMSNQNKIELHGWWWTWKVINWRSAWNILCFPSMWSMWRVSKRLIFPGGKQQWRW